MKQRTKWLTFIAVLWFICLFFFLYLLSRYDAQEDTEFNQLKLIDCQTIRIDESFIGKKAREQTVCFWEIRINGKDMVMYKEIGKDKYGFVEGR